MFELLICFKKGPVKTVTDDVIMKILKTMKWSSSRDCFSGGVVAMEGGKVIHIHSIY